MNKEQIKNTALGLASLIAVGSAVGCIATKKDIEISTASLASKTNDKVKGIDDRLNEIQELINKSQEEKEQLKQETTGVDFNKGASIYNLTIEANTIQKVYSKEGLLVRDQVTGKVYATNQDTILFIISGAGENKITLENLPKTGTNLKTIKDEEVKNYSHFTEKYADELKPETTGIQNIIIADFDCNGEVRIRAACIVLKAEEIKKEEPKKEKTIVVVKEVVVKERVVIEKIVEKQPETPKTPAETNNEATKTNEEATKRKADEEAKRKADEEAKRKADEEAKRKTEEALQRQSIHVESNVEWKAQPGWIVSGDIEYWNGTRWQRLYDTWQDYPEGQDRSAKTADIIVIKKEIKVRGSWGFTRSLNIPLEEIKTNKEKETNQEGKKIFDEVRVKYL